MRTHAILRPLLALMLVLVLALGMLLYIASVDARRTQAGFLLDRINSSAEIIQHPIESLLQAGLPLSQLVGFDIITNSILYSDEAIHDISIIDNQGRVLFQNARPGYESAPPSDFVASTDIIVDRDYEVYQTAGEFQVRVPLAGRFDQPGVLLVTMPATVVSADINRYLLPVVFVSVLVLIIYTLVLSVLFAKRRVSTLLANVVYSFAVISVSGFLIGALIQLYSVGTQERARTFADSLSTRLGAIFDVGLDINDVDGLDDLFVNYQELNPDIAFISLIKDDVIVAHTDVAYRGTRYQPTVGNIEYYQDIRADLGVAISVAIPQRVIFNQLLRNIKNFTVLFFASAFLSWLLLRMLFSIYPDIHSDVSPTALATESRRSRVVPDLILPAFFLANLIEGLHYSYFPQFFSMLAADAGLAGSRIGGLYALYWGVYALVLIPAGRWARTLAGIRGLLVSGFILIASSMVLIILLQQFSWMYFLRALAGLGQGMVFIAVQSYVLQQSSEHQRTKAVSIIVYGYNGGVISGTIIGALLVSSLGINRLLFISAAVALCMVWYSVVIVDRVRKYRALGISEDTAAHVPSARVRRSLYVHGTGSGLSVQKGFFHRIALLCTDREFTKTILCVGLITKAVLAGVVFLALPHFLSNLNYQQEDIGQILIFYTVGVLLVSRLVAQYADRIGNTRRILFLGAIGSALGLAIIAFSHTVRDSFALQTAVLVGGIFLLGFAHGFIHAPIVTHITFAPVSNVLGQTVIASIYRFTERIGHVLGPLIFGYFLLQPSVHINAIYYIAITVGVLSLLFYFIPSTPTPPNVPRDD